MPVLAEVQPATLVAPAMFQSPSRDDACSGPLLRAYCAHPSKFQSPSRDDACSGIGAGVGGCVGGGRSNPQVGMMPVLAARYLYALCEVSRFQSPSRDDACSGVMLAPATAENLIRSNPQVGMMPVLAQLAI